MRTLAVVGASYLQKPLVEKAKAMGLYVLCFAWREGAVCADVADEFYPISIVEKDQILEVCRQKKIDGICSIASDVAAPTVSYVAEHLGLIANSYDVAVRANNKFMMREAFSLAGAPCPAYHMVNDLLGVEKIKEHLRFPLIIKPADRSGSLGVTKVEEPANLEGAVTTALSCSFNHQAMIEEFIEGREISVEFISYRGVHYPLTITDKVTTGAPHFVELEHHQPSTLSAATYVEIYDITRRALDSLGITDGASHSEYKITEDGRVIIMEIGARMGGDFIGSDLVQLSTGYDFLKGVIDVALGQFEVPDFPINKNSGVFFLCKETEHILHYLKAPEDYPELIKCEITEGPIKSAACSADRSGYMIYQNSTGKRFKL